MFFYFWLVDSRKINHWLVVAIPLRNMLVSWDDYSQYMEKIQITNQITYRSAAKLPILLGRTSGSQACPLSPSPPTAAGTHLAYGRALKHRWMRLLLVLV